MREIAWINKFLDLPLEERKKFKERVLNTVEERDGDKGRVMRSLASKSENKLIGSPPTLVFLKLEGTKEDLSNAWVYPIHYTEPCLLYYNTNQGSLVTIGAKFKESRCIKVPLSHFEKSGIKETLSWVKTFLKSDSKFRKSRADAILNDITSAKGVAESNEQMQNLKKYIGSSKIRKLGIIPTMAYMKIEGDKDDLPYMWIHPFGNPGLLCYDEPYSAFSVVSSGIKFNDSVVNDFKQNKKVYMQGISGP